MVIGECWELQFKGVGFMFFFRQVDGCKVLWLSIWEFLCSEVMFYLGVFIIWVGVCVMFEFMVVCDVFYDGNFKYE